MPRDAIEEIKKRHIRALKKGHKKSISQAIIDKYNWTVDELQILKPFINNIKPFETKNTSISNNVFTTNEMFGLLDHFVENKTTLKNYRSRVNALNKLLNVQNEQFSDIFCNVKTLSKAIVDKYSDPTAYFGFLLFILSKSQKLLDIATKQYNKIRGDVTTDDVFDVLKTQFNNYKNTQIVNQLKDRRKDLNYEAVYKNIFKKEDVLNNSEYASTHHLIAVMYTRALYDENDTIHINPRNYFQCVKLVNKDIDMDEENNFYNTKTGRLLLNDYKTSGIYKSYDVLLSKKVQKIINDSIDKNKRTYLIEKEKGGTMAPNSLSEMVQRVMGHTIDTIRKSIESYEINVKKTSREHLAWVSRHTIITQEVSYLAQTTQYAHH